MKASMAIGVLLRAAVCCCFVPEQLCAAVLLRAAVCCCFVSEQRCAAVLLRPAVCCCFVPEQRCAAVRLRAAVCCYFVLERLCAAVLLRAVMGVLDARVVPRSSRPFFFLPSERVHEYPKPPAICPAQACRTSGAACDPRHPLTSSHKCRQLRLSSKPRLQLHSPATRRAKMSKPPSDSDRNRKPQVFAKRVQSQSKSTRNHFRRNLRINGRQRLESTFPNRRRRLESLKK